jgi:hypothetical protein
VPPDAREQRLPAVQRSGELVILRVHRCDEGLFDVDQPVVKAPFFPPPPVEDVRNVDVGVDESRHDELARGVYQPLRVHVRCYLLGRPDFDDVSPLDCHGTVFVDPAVGIHCHDHTVRYEDLCGGHRFSQTSGGETRFLQKCGSSARISNITGIRYVSTRPCDIYEATISIFTHNQHIDYQTLEYLSYGKGHVAYLG